MKIQKQLTSPFKKAYKKLSQKLKTFILKKLNVPAQMLMLAEQHRTYKVESAGCRQKIESCEVNILLLFADLKNANNQQQKSTAQLTVSEQEKTFYRDLADWNSKTLLFLAEQQKPLFMERPRGTYAEDWPIISIIMPVWNREDFIGEAIESVIEQFYPHFEIDFDYVFIMEPDTLFMEPIAVDFQDHVYAAAVNGATPPILF